MKIGILTMHYRRNYGGILQSYSLYKYLKSLNHDVTIIDYREDTSINNYHIVSVFQELYKRMLQLIKKAFCHNHSLSILPTRPLSNELLQAFQSFKDEYLQYTRPVNNKTIKEVVNNFDMIVIGSDQVWTSVKYKKLIFFGDFGIEYSGRLISYAACSINSIPPLYQKRKLSRLLNRFDYISVRDETTYNFVESINKELNISMVADPTFLHDFKEFSSQTYEKENYIFAYVLGSEIQGGHEAVLSKIKSKYGDIKIVSVVISNVSLEAEKFADIVIDTASPIEWVSLIAHAKFVYTDSFHGCVFSMKFHKPFLGYYNSGNRASRLLDLKNKFGLNNIVSSVHEVNLSSEINYEKIDMINDKITNKSCKFINEAISINK